MFFLSDVHQAKKYLDSGFMSWGILNITFQESSRTFVGDYILIFVG
jgi:hypothetical protein